MLPDLVAIEHPLKGALHNAPPRPMASWRWQSGKWMRAMHMAFPSR
jgi:hypothetical protein